MDRRTAKGPLPERRLIRLAGRTVEYRFARRRRRTLGVTVDANGLSVAAPMRAAFRDIESFLRDKERWIVRKLEDWAQAPRPAVLRAQSGETMPLFGAPLTLEVREGGRAVRHDADRLVVCVPAPVRAAETLVGWLKTRALEALAPRAEHYAERLGVPAPCVGLTSARSQWGVCMEGGAIRLNWRLVHLDADLSDYVVAHEVAHLVEMNHSKRFWSLVSGLYPAWREARERLELAGAAIPIIEGAR